MFDLLNIGIEQIVSAIVSKKFRDEMNSKYKWYLSFGHIREDR